MLVLNQKAGFSQETPLHDQTGLTSAIHQRCVASLQAASPLSGQPLSSGLRATRTDSPESAPQTSAPPPPHRRTLRKRACAASGAYCAISQRAVAPAHVTLAGQCLASALCSWLLGDSWGCGLVFVLPGAWRALTLSGFLACGSPGGGPAPAPLRLPGSNPGVRGLVMLRDQLGG